MPMNMRMFRRKAETQNKELSFGEEKKVIGVGLPMKVNRLNKNYLPQVSWNCGQSSLKTKDKNNTRLLRAQQIMSPEKKKGRVDMIEAL